MKKIFPVVLGLIWLAISVPLEAEQAPVKMQAQRLIYNETKHLMKLFDQVRIEYLGGIATAAYAEFHTDTQEAYFNKNTKISHPDFVLNAAQVRVWYKDRSAKAEGEVLLVSSHLTAGQKPPAPLSKLYCDQLEIFWNKSTAYAHGNVKVEQGTKTAYADEAIYYLNHKVLDLSGHVRFERDGEWLNCAKARMDLTQETFSALGGVEGNLIAPPPANAGQNPEPQDNAPLPELKD